MIWSAPVALSFPEPLTPAQRLSLFFGNYDSRVYFSDTAYVEVGAGSLPCVRQIVSISPGSDGLLGTIGRFCEFNETARVHYNGEHDSDNPVNISFGVLVIKGDQVPNGALKPGRPFEIGNGVVISSRAEILAGVKIGDGAVIGAASVVTADVEPYAVVVGSPARTIRKRQAPAVRWWDFSTRYLLENFQGLNAVSTRAGHEWREKRPPFVFRVRGSTFELLGFLDGDCIVGLDGAPPSVRRYAVSALNEQEPQYWVPDCWSSDAPA